MRKLIGILAVAFLGLTGCSRESEPGGPGVTQGGPVPVTEDVREAREELQEARQEARAEAGEERTFTLSVPTGTDVERGNRQPVEISIDRGDEFDQAVKLQFQSPAGFRVLPDEVKIQAGEESANVLIEAAPDAPIGERTVTVTGIPETGAAVAVGMPVEVQERD